MECFAPVGHRAVLKVGCRGSTTFLPSAMLEPVLVTERAGGEIGPDAPLDWANATLTFTSPKLTEASR